jgi:hypothetical protein
MYRSLTLAWGLEGRRLAASASNDTFDPSFECRAASVFQFPQYLALANHLFLAVITVKAAASAGKYLRARIF